MSIMEIRGLTHVYSRGTPFEKTAIDALELDIPRGCVTGLIGHTGSGKSTLIQHLNALLKPTSGTVLLEGQDIFAGLQADGSVAGFGHHGPKILFQLIRSKADGLIIPHFLDGE